MILSRYLNRQAWVTSLMTLAVLLAVVSALFLAELLSQAAQGQLPAVAVLGLLVLRLPEAMLMVAPLALLVGVLFALGQAHESGEITIARASGMGFGDCFKPLLGLACVWAGVVLVVSGWVLPWTIAQTDRVLEQSAGEMLASSLQPGQFDRLNQGRMTVYVARVDDNASSLSDVFVQHSASGVEEMIAAPKGQLRLDPIDGRRYLSLSNGHQLRQDGDGWMRLEFANNDIRLPPPTARPNQNPEMMAPLPELLSPTNAVEQREWHWRLASPVGTLLLGLLAIPLAWRVPRAGRFGSVVVALMVYLIYSNGVHVGLVWMEQSNQVRGLGLWPIHGALAMAVLALGAWRWRQW